MALFDLVKATLICGGLAFLIYSYPVVGQVFMIGFLAVLWVLYAHRAIRSLLTR